MREPSRCRIGMIALVLAGVLFPIVPEASAQSCALVNPCGDVNGSGTVTSGDALAVLRAAVGQPVDVTCEVEDSGPQTPLLRTGQTDCHDIAGVMVSCAGTGHDGEIQAGLLPSYTNNGDGTITDHSTGLDWEVLDDNGFASYTGIHDWDRTYTWPEAFGKIADLNSNEFAGHSDWRLPNLRELASIVNMGQYEPAVDPVFATDCAALCASPACSCTKSDYYWSSTTYQHFQAHAYGLFFGTGEQFHDEKKHFTAHVRAVRGGM